MSKLGLAHNMMFRFIYNQGDYGVDTGDLRTLNICRKQSLNETNLLEQSKNSGNTKSMGECNTILSAYTLYRYLELCCIHPSKYPLPFSKLNKGPKKGPTNG